MGLSKHHEQQAQSLARELNNKNHAAVLAKIKRLVMGDNPSMRTITIRFSLIKKIFKKHTHDADFLAKIKPDPRITEKVVTQNKTRRDTAKRRRITYSQVHTLMGFKDSNDVYELAMFLLFVSGRRVRELFVAHFIDDKKSNRIKANGLLKRSDKVECQFRPIGKKSDFFSALSKFRAMAKKMTFDAFSRGLNRKIKRVFNDDTIHPHSLRGMYITYLFKHHNDENMAINPFIQRHLCHQNINSSLSYIQYTLA